MKNDRASAYIVKIKKSLINAMGKREEYTEVVAHCTNYEDAKKVADDYPDAQIEEVNADENRSR